MSRLHCNPNKHHLSVPLLAALLWGLPCSLEASIVLPDETPLDLEQLFADAEPRPASSRMSLPTNHQQNGNDPDQSNEVVSIIPSPSAPGGSSSGASSSSSSGSGGASSFPLAAITAANPCDAELIAWVRGERRFTLPTPPGNAVFRPPRQV